MDIYSHGDMNLLKILLQIKDNWPKLSLEYKTENNGKLKKEVTKYFNSYL